MRILAISNFYPPHFVGGYELGCRDVVDGLRELGYDVQVLTSSYGVERRVDEGTVHRWLTARQFGAPGKLARWAEMTAMEVRNQSALRCAVRRFRPDLIYIWNISGVTLSLALAAERTGVPVCYYVSDLWPIHWVSDRTYRLFSARGNALHCVARTIARPILWAAGAYPPTGRPRLRYAQFTSGFVRSQVLEAAYTPDKDWVIPWAVDLTKFQPTPVRWPPRKVLYVGQLAEQKGIHTALEAFARVARLDIGAGLTLTLVGGSTAQPDYERQLRGAVVRFGLADRIRFTGQIPREELPRLYADHDILLFPSEWEEPFSITLVEALASQLAVVSTMTGGTPEIVSPGDNALVFAAGRADRCAECLITLLTDRCVYEAIRQKAGETIENRYGLPRMLSQVELSIKEIMAA